MPTSSYLSLGKGYEMNKFYLGFAISGAALLGGLSVVNAASPSTSNLQVKASVERSCSVTTQGLDFGSLSSGAEKEISTTLTVGCTSGAATKLTIGDGLGSASATTREMLNGSNKIGYQLYNTSRSAGNLIPKAHTGIADPVTMTLVGYVPSQQITGDGNFSDTVTLTLEY